MSRKERPLPKLVPGASELQIVASIHYDDCPQWLKDIVDDEERGWLAAEAASLLRAKLSSGYYHRERERRVNTLERLIRNK